MRVFQANFACIGLVPLHRVRGGPKQEIKPGDVIWTPPGVKHWHGATRSSAMTHIAIQEHVNNKVVDWMEHLTDEQYGD